MKTLAIFPGSFNPFTIGHQNVLEKAEAIFGKENVVIAVGINPDKNPFNSGTWSQATKAPHVRTIQKNLPSKTVVGFYDFLTDFVWEKEQEGYNVVVVKGLRNGTDFEHENTQLRYMQDMKPDLKIVYIPCDRHLEHVSSSGYRSLEKIKPAAGFKYLAKEHEIESSPTAKEIESFDNVVIVDKNAIDMLEKYRLLPKKQVTNEVFDFSGTYKECLIWIKEQEANKNNEKTD